MAAQDNDIKNKRPDALMVDELTDLSEEDIEKMLQKSSDTSNDETDTATSAADEAGGDVLMDLLEQSEDAELNDIHSMLQKSENNEAIDSSVEDLIRQASDPEDMVPDLEAQEALEMVKEMTDPKEFKKNAAAEKRRLKMEKKREAQRLKEEKRKEKEAKNGKKTKKTKGKKTDDIEVMDLGSDSDDINIPSLGEASDKPKRDLEYDENMVIPQLSESNDLNPDEFDNIVSGLDKVEVKDAETLFEGQEVSTDQLVEQEIERFQEAQAQENGEGKKDGKEEKKGFFARLFQMLTQTPEDEEEESGEIKLSDENEAILKEMDEGKKGKKKKEKGKKKGKKGEAAGGEGEEGAEGGGDDKKGKKEKKKKPKKEKAPKLESAEGNKKKLPKKGIIMIIAFCISLGAVIFLINLFVSDHALKKNAKNAFYNEDYQTCYQNLYGKKRNETEEVMYHKSECIMKAQIWIKEYEKLIEDGNRLYALDRLVQAVHQYPDLERTAIKWNCGEKVAELYQTILGHLMEQFGVSEELAKEVASISNDVEYTKKLREIIKNPSGVLDTKEKSAEPGVITGQYEKDIISNPDESQDDKDLQTPNEVEQVSEAPVEQVNEISIPAAIDNKDERLLPQDAKNE